jgi:hypothetical protein
LTTIDGALKRRSKPRGAPRPAAPPGDGDRKRAPAEPVPGDRRRPDALARNPDVEREDPSDEDDEDEPPTDQTEPPVVTNGAAPGHDGPFGRSAVERFLAAAETIDECSIEACLEIEGGIDAATRAALDESVSRTYACAHKVREALDALEDAGPGDD